MKFQLVSAIMALGASALSIENASFKPAMLGPYRLHITGKFNKSIDGYASSKSLSPRMKSQVLLYNSRNMPREEVSFNSWHFYFNATRETKGMKIGELQWNMAESNNTTGMIKKPTPEALSLIFDPLSNVAVAKFFPGHSSLATAERIVSSQRALALDKDLKMLLYSMSAVDDSKSTHDKFPRPSAQAHSNWHLCHNYFGTKKYLQTISWVMSTSGVSKDIKLAQNPTCEPVDIQLEQAVMSPPEFW